VLKASLAAIAAPVVVPGSALGLSEQPAASERITMGCIGCGGRMRGVMAAFSGLKEVQAVATCDVRRTNSEAFGKKLGVDARSCYTDFRELVARDDIDTVSIATPDHWHVLQTIAAMRAGKDVYCEKPLSNTIEEGRALVETAGRYGAVFQHGTQLHSMGGVRRACELVRNGRIGKLKEVRIGSPPGKACGPMPGEPVPKEIDYDLWLGPAPEVPYVGQVVNRKGWYFVADYSKSGWIAGYGVHDLDIAQWGINQDRTGPVRIVGHGDYPRGGLFDTVLTYEIEFEYANGAKIIMTDKSKNRHGVKFIGEKGWIFTRGGIEAEPKSLLNETIGPDEIHLYNSPGHASNFIDCVKSRKETITPPEIAHRATSTALLGGIACQLDRPLQWDPKAERFVDDAEADRLLTYAMRSPWRL
jgi:predicted dehydrogenase